MAIGDPFPRQKKLKRIVQRLHAAAAVVCACNETTGNYFNGRERYRSEFDDALDNYLKRLLHDQTALFELVKFHYTDWTNRSALYDYQRGDVSF